MADLNVKLSTLLIDIGTLGTVGTVVVLIGRVFTPHRRGIFCGDESIQFPDEPNPTFTSRTIAATCILISFSTVSVTIYSHGGIILLIFVTAVTPTKRGIYCDDESIQYPFHPSTIPNYLLYIYGFTIPLVLIIVTEVFANRRSHGKGKFFVLNAPNWVLYIYRSLVDFGFGMAAAQLVTDVGKYSIGRLRPNFISVCKPNINFANCAQYNHTYILDYKCEDEAEAVKSRVSFPSGHSSFSAYTMLYCAIFIQVKWRAGNSSVLRMLKHGLQLVLILLAYFTAVSRVMDNKHHWSDVTAGGLIGVIAAALTAKYVAKLNPNSPLLRAGSSREANFEGITINDDESDSRRARTPKDQNGSELGSTRTQESYLLSPLSTPSKEEL